MLEDGVDPNLKNPDGSTALYIAIRNEKFEAVRVLLSGGASVQAEVLSDETSLHLAAAYPDVNILKLVLKYTKGVCLDLFDEIGRTPLICAISENLHEHVSVLICAGADVNSRQEPGLTCNSLSQVIESSDIYMFYILLASGLDVAELHDEYTSVVIRERCEKSGSLSVYQYCVSNPILHVDLYGLKSTHCRTFDCDVWIDYFSDYGWGHESNPLISCEEWNWGNCVVKCMLDNQGMWDTEERDQVKYEQWIVYCLDGCDKYYPIPAVINKPCREFPAKPKPKPSPPATKPTRPGWKKCVTGKWVPPECCYRVKMKGIPAPVLVEIPNLDPGDCVGWAKKGIAWEQGFGPRYKKCVKCSNAHKI